MSEQPPPTFGEMPGSADPPPGAPTPPPGTDGTASSLGPPSAAPAAAVMGDDWIARLVQPGQESRNWLKFMGLVSIALGGLSALTIVGLIIAWLYVWVGVLLWQAGDRAGWAYAQKSAYMLEQYLAKMRTVIAILGVVTAIHVVITVISIGFFFTLGGLATVLNAFD